MTQHSTGRINQKRRTRTAILRAATELLRDGGQVTMREIAREALVSEATAYRYFPDLPTLLREAVAGQLFDPVEALRPVERSPDPVVRVATAAEYLLRHVLAHEGAVRAMIAATITRPADATARPGLRFGLIEQSLAPPAELNGLDGDALAQLKRDLSVVVSAEALFGLLDQHRLTPEQAVASLARIAITLTRETLDRS
ncbi:TetR/AcrR family transcriptional regulator [Amycolatopsis pigmentata]|uniref:TetR/AcrR family transcriptional regulator n=1 Tax=Amycolatopsis pigmentata TaxID=450801 RepID=A0ABW5FX44_9PSEU